MSSVKWKIRTRFAGEWRRGAGDGECSLAHSRPSALVNSAVVPALRKPDGGLLRKGATSLMHFCVADARSRFHPRLFRELRAEPRDEHHAGTVRTYVKNMLESPSEPPPWSIINVLIVDQHLTFRDALATRLQAEPDLVVVAKTHSAEFAPRVLAGRSADVILLDAELPDDSAFVFCSELARRGGRSRVVMLSAVSRPERIVAAVRAGAAAWVRKDESIDHLLRVIRGVVRGDTWISPRELGPVLRLLIGAQADRSDSTHRG